MQFQLGWLVLVMLVYALAGLSLGVLLMPLFVRRETELISITAWTCSAFLLGHSILANVWILLGLSGLLSPWIIGTILVGLILIGGSRTFALCRQFHSTLCLAATGIFQEPWPWRLVSFGCLVLVALYFLQALVVPLEPQGDAVACYMAYGKLMAAEQRVLPLPKYEVFAQTGLQGEMHWAALLSLGAGTQSKWFAWPFGVVAGLLLVELASRAGLNRRGKWLALTMLFTSHAFTYHLWDGKVDLFSAAIGIAACYWLLQAGQNLHQPGLLHLAGVFLGFALLCKMTLLVALVPGLMLLRIWQLSVESKTFAGWSWLVRQCAQSAFVAGGWIIVTSVPQLIKNTLLFGEPLAPFVLLNGGAAMTDQTWFTPAMTRYIVAIYPFALVFGKFPMMGGTLSALVLMFLPLVFFVTRSTDWRRSVLLQLACVGLIGLILWVIARPSVLAPRYILPPLMLLILPAAYAAQWLSERKNSSVVLSSCCLGAFVVIELVTLKHAVNVDHVLDQSMRYFSSRHEESTHPSSRAIEFVNQQAGAGERVFLAMHIRYWFRGDLLKHLDSDQEFAQVVAKENAEERWQAIRRGGFRFLLLDQNVYGAFGAALGIEPTSGEIASLPAGLNVTRRFHGAGYWVYEISHSSNAPSSTGALPARSASEE